MRHLLRVLMAVLLIAVPATAAVVLAPAAQATYIHPVVYLVESARVNNGSCLAMGTTGDPTMVSCAYPATSAPQRFNLLTDPSTGGLWLASNGTTRCVTASGSGALVRTGCSSDPRALWDLRWNEEISLQLVNRATGRCLGPGSSWLAPPVQEPCSLAAEWFAVPILDKYQFQPTHTFHCLDIWNNDGGMQATDPAQQWTCLGRNQTNQLWDLELSSLPRWLSNFGVSYVQPPVYELHPMHNEGMCLMNDQHYDDGYRVHQGVCGPGAGWDLYPLDLTPGSERFQVRAETAHAIDHQVCLDVDSGAGGADGAKVQLWRCLGAGQANQIWQPVQLFP